MADLSQINADVAHKPTLVLYLRLTVDEAMRRIKRRAEEEGREFEKDITEEYLQELDSMYEELYKDREDVIRLDSNMPPDEIKREVADQLKYNAAKYNRVLEDKGFSKAEAEELLMHMISCFGNRLEPTLDADLDQKANTTHTGPADCIDILPYTLSSKGNLANAPQKQGKLQEAEEMNRDVLVTKPQVPGEEDDDTVDTMNNKLANVLRKLEVLRKELGLEHPNTLASITCLASVLRKQGRWQEAEKMHREVLEVQRRVLGREHPDTLASMTNLASLREQEEMHREALETMHRVLGLDTLASMTNRANVLQEQGKWQEAEEMHREVLEVQRRVLGQEHQDTLASMNGLANVLQEQGQWQEAEEMHREVLEVRRRVLGQEHPDTLASMSNLAMVLRDQGQWQEAEEMHREVLEVRRRVLGQEHPDTLASMNNLANVLREQGQWQEAEEMHREVLEVRRRVLGQEHPDTLASMSNLAMVLREQGQWQEAEEMHREVLEVRRRVLGQEHPDTLNSMSNLANVLRDQGQWQEAEQMHREVLEIRRRVLGEKHPDTLSSMTNLASVLPERDAQDWQFRYSLSLASHVERLTDAIGKLRTAIAAFEQRADDDHPQLLQQNRLLAKLLLQINHESSLDEAENLLLRLVPALQERYGPRHPMTQEATGDLVFLLEEHGNHAEEWRQHLNQMENATDSSALPFADENLSTEDWEGREELTELLRDLLEGKLVRAASASSAASSSAASKIPTIRDDLVSSDRSEQLSHSMASEAGYTHHSRESVDASSSDSLAWLRAARDTKLKERNQR